MSMFRKNAVPEKTPEEKIDDALRSVCAAAAKIIHYDRYQRPPTYRCCECGHALGELFCYDPVHGEFVCTDCGNHTHTIGEWNVTREGRNVITLTTKLYRPDSVFDGLTEAAMEEKLHGICSDICRGDFPCAQCGKHIRFVLAVDEETGKIYCEDCVGTHTSLSRQVLNAHDFYGRPTQHAGLAGHSFLYLRADVFGDVPAWMPNGANDKAKKTDPKLLKLAEAIAAGRGKCAVCGSPIKDHFTCHTGKFSRAYCFKCIHWEGHMKEGGEDDAPTVSYSAEEVIKEAKAEK